MQRKKDRDTTDVTGETTTLLGQGSSFRGDLAGTGSFIIGGQVTGECDIDGTLTLSIGGSWHGSIRARDVIVAGRVEGEVHASGKLEITSTAQVTGDVSGAEIAIAEGAVIDGGMSVSNRPNLDSFESKRVSSLRA